MFTLLKLTDIFILLRPNCKWRKCILSDFFFWSWLLLTITLINNYTTYKSIHYSTYITYNLIWHFYTEQKKRERKATYNAFSKQVPGGLTFPALKFWMLIKLGILVVKFAFATANLKIETLRMRRRFARVLPAPHSVLGQFALFLLALPNRGQTLRANLQINPNFLFNTPPPETSETLSM